MGEHRGEDSGTVLAGNEGRGVGVVPGYVVPETAGSEFLSIVAAGMTGGELAGSAGLGIDSMYKALTWIVATVADMMADKGEPATRREVLEATGSMVLGWDLTQDEMQWRSNWAPEVATENAFVQICNENGFDVVGESLQERGMRKEPPMVTGGSFAKGSAG